MNKVLTREMLAADLPAHVRGEIAADHRVVVVVRDLGATPGTPSRKGGGSFSRFFDLGRQNFGSVEEVVEHVRSIRDGEDRLP